MKIFSLQFKSKKRENFSLYLLVFLLSLLFFGYFQLTPTLADPDSFYHAKTALLIKNQGIIKEFPWLQYTILKDNYIDHHLLYHILLVPFLIFFSPLIGIKIAVVIFSSLSVLFFYWLLKKFKISYPFLYIFLLLTSAPWLFRLNLAKAQPLSLIILFLSVYFLFQKKYLYLFLISFIYVWTYNGWPLIIIWLFSYLLAYFIHQIYFSEENYLKKITHLLPFKKKTNGLKKIAYYFYKTIKENKYSLLSVFGGIIAGIIINPYFPKNLFFYWVHIFKIGVINQAEKLHAGVEWYPYPGREFIYGTITILIIWIFSFIWYSERFKKKSVKTLSLGIFSLFFFLYTLKSRRNIEYFIPFALLFTAFSLKDFWLSINWLEFGEKIKETFFQGKKRFLSSLLATYLILFSLFFVANYFVKGIKEVRNELANGFPLTKFQKSAEWLEKNTPKHSLIFHSCWTDTPFLFYYNTHNYYLVGLDPTFMYQYNKELFWQWLNITQGNPPLTYPYSEKIKENKEKFNYDLAKIIKKNFRSSYVFINKDHPAMKENIEKNKKFKLIYQDKEATIYQIEE